MTPRPTTGHAVATNASRAAVVVLALVFGYLYYVQVDLAWWMVPDRYDDGLPTWFRVAVGLWLVAPVIPLIVGWYRARRASPVNWVRVLVLACGLSLVAELYLASVFYL